MPLSTIIVMIAIPVLVVILFNVDFHKNDHNQEEIDYEEIKNKRGKKKK